MGIFAKKTCPLCGNKTGILSFRIANGEKICSACEKKLRGRYDMIRRGAVFYDTLEKLNAAQGKQIVEKMMANQESDIAKLGSKYKNIVSVLDTFAVPSAGLDRGGDEITALGGKCTALSFCELGAFKQGDAVHIIGQEGKKEATILKLIPCTGAYPFETELIEGIHKTAFSENTNAWLVLNIDNAEIKTGDIIVK